MLELYILKIFYRIILIILLVSLPTPVLSKHYKNNEIPEHTLNVSFDVGQSKISGILRTNGKAGQELLFKKGSLQIIDIRLNNRSIDFNNHKKTLKITPEDDGVIEIHYEGVFKGMSSRNNTFRSIRNVIDERGISLTQTWYPVIDALSYYNLSVTLPEGYEALSEAEDIKKIKRRGSVEFNFTFSHPIDKIHLIASKKYKILRDSFRHVKIYAYFFEEDLNLAHNYLEFTKKYIKLYEKLLDRFPYKRFSIVENFLPTGYSMPTYTLLGKTVVKLPFIVETSLGHEILHQWFGNLIYVDYQRGNWAEGLTTYLADHLYQEQKDRGWEFRKQMLVDYKSYVTTQNEFPLNKFVYGADPASKAIGYGKTSLTFHMLKKIVGEEKFFNALKYFIKEYRFKIALWDDIRISFEKVYGESLEWFFRQWVTEKGLPQLSLHNIKVKHLNGHFELQFHILQKDMDYRMEVPVTIYTKRRKIKRSFRVIESENEFEVTLSDKPEKIVIDEDYDIARILTEDEFPPVITRLLKDEKMIISLPPDNKKFYQSVLDHFWKKEPLIKEARDIKDADIKNSSVVILGLDNPLIGRLYGKLVTEDAGFSVLVKENPWNPEKVVGIFHGKSKDEIEAAFRKISHYGKYTQLSFNSGRNIHKKIEESQRGIVRKLKQEATAVDISAIKELQDVISGVAAKKIIYVGEIHDVFAHHAVQLDIIKGVYRQNRNIAVGMEMFQRLFQKTLDSFIEGRLDERDFLKRSEYFKRWGFDYNLYKPILDFARAEKIPVLALNINREIIEKVSENGIDSLSDEEKQLIPPEMDFSDNEYRERIKEVFKLHKNSENKNFDFFYQSQLLWDETMSLSIDEFFREYPDYQMVVLAGTGHLEYGSGIPKRTYRRNGKTYAIVLIDAKVEKDIADYVIFPMPVEGVTAPKLMAFLKIENKRIEIAGFPDESVSQNAGLKIGDIILSMDDNAVTSIEDIKIQLFYKEKGKTIKVRILRKEEEKEKEIEFEVTL
jgi:uncharacterized iron-regulated protein